MSFRTALPALRVLRTSTLSLSRSLSTTRAFRPTTLSSQTKSAQWQSTKLQVRYSSSGALTRDDIQTRILEVLGSFEKCDPAKITPTAAFTSDLGLDSLDAVEVVMAIEEEFSIEIPDEEADKISTVGEAISYIERTPEAH